MIDVEVGKNRVLKVPEGVKWETLLRLEQRAVQSRDCDVMVLSQGVTTCHPKTRNALQLQVL
jgi:hypothetical protein